MHMPVFAFPPVILCIRICVCVCFYVCILQDMHLDMRACCIHIHVCLGACVGISTCDALYMHWMFVYTCVFHRRCICVCLRFVFVHVYIHLYVPVRAFPYVTCICTCLCMRIYSHISDVHTHDVPVCAFLSAVLCLRILRE